MFQSQDEDRSLHDIENCRTLWNNSTPRLKQKWPLLKPMDQQPMNRLRFKNGSELVGIVGDPRKIKSEHPTIYIQDESAIIVEGMEALNEAIATRCGKIWCVSSAAPGWYADLVDAGLYAPWPDYSSTEIGKNVELEDKPRPVQKFYSPHWGVEFKRAINDAAIFDLDISADPSFRDSPVRLEKLRKKFTSEAMYNREIKRQAYALSGATVYPEFKTEVHVVPHEHIPKEGCMYMALDPHPRTPHAFLWIMIDKWSDWWVYRELWKSKIYGRPGRLAEDDSEVQYTIKEYVEACAWLEGNKIEWDNPETDSETGLYTRTERGELVIDRYMDQAGKAFVASEVDHETYAGRYTRYGMSFLDPRKDHDVGEDAIRELLKSRKHDLKGEWPRLHISDQCPELILELQRHRYKVMRRSVQERELTQDRSTFRVHLVDCLRYLAVSPILYIARLSSKRYDRATSGG